MLGPNSTAATKLLPLEPYQRWVFGYCLAANEASEPNWPAVKATGMLGAESSKCGAIESSRRWKRLIRPHGARQVPKLRVRRSEASASAASFSCGEVRVRMYS